MSESRFEKFIAQEENKQPQQAEDILEYVHDIPNEAMHHMLINAGSIKSLFKNFNRGLLAVNIATDAETFLDEYEKSKQINNYDNTLRTSISITAGWTGAWLMGATFAETGAAICAPLTPVSSAVCAVVGGLVGSYVGYNTVSDLTLRLYDAERVNAEAIQSLPLFTNGEKAQFIYDYFYKPQELEFYGKTAIKPFISCAGESMLGHNAIDSNDVRGGANHSSAHPVPQSYDSPLLSDQQTEALFDKLQQDTTDLIDIWAQNETNIIGFEGCPDIVLQANKVAELRAANAPKHIVKPAVAALKDAKFKEHANRVEFDQTLASAEGIVKLTAAGVILGNNKLARKVMSVGGAMLTIGKEVSALAGFGTAAATANPYLAAGNIALAVLGLFDDGNGEAMNVIFEELQQIKQMIENFRQEMHERFDIIEVKLEKIYHDVCHKIEEIRLLNEATQLDIKHLGQENKRLHHHTHDHLLTVQNRINALYASVRKQSINDALHDITDPIGICVNNLEVLPTPEKYATYLAQFQLFIEQSSYSALLAGERDHFQKQLSIDSNFDQQHSNEADFNINSLLGFLEQHFSAFQQTTSQPNFIVWAYASLAILRLVYLTNRSDEAQIRQKEFDLLALIKNKVEQQLNFRNQIKNPAIAWHLVSDYQQALLTFAYQLQAELEKLNHAQNQKLNESLFVAYKTLWHHESATISGQSITVRTDYPDWFVSWSETHYGPNGKGRRVVAKPREDYEAARNARLTEHKKMPAMPAFKQQAGIHLVNQLNPDFAETIAFDIHDFPRLAIRPKDNDMPYLNLHSPQGYIDLLAKFSISPSVLAAEYLALGQLEFRYQFDAEKNMLLIEAGLERLGQFYALAGLEMPFYIGPYDKNEGIIWGWYGDTTIAIKQIGPFRYLGSSDNPKHWFKGYGKVPEFSCPDAGPMKSLAQPSCDKVREYKIVSNIKYHENTALIEKMVSDCRADIYQQYAHDVRKLLFSDGKLSQALQTLEGASQRLEMYMMLVLNDHFANPQECMNYLFTDQLYVPSITEIKKAFADDEAIAERVFGLIDKISGAAASLNNMRESLCNLIAERKNKTDHVLFDKVYQLIVDAYKFYENRVDKTDTYKNIFKENEQSKKNFEDVNSMLQILASAMASEVKDKDTQQRILNVVQAQMQAQGLVLPSGVTNQLPATVTQTQSPLQRFSLLSNNTAEQNKESLNNTNFRPAHK